MAFALGRGQERHDAEQVRIGKRRAAAPGLHGHECLLAKPLDALVYS